MDGNRRVVLMLGAVVLALGLGAIGIGLLPSGNAAEAAPRSANHYQGVQATGILTLGQGTCFPDAVLLDCNGNVTHQLKGPGGSGFFAPYLGQPVQLDGSELTCVAGDKYVQVVNIAVVPDPCGTPTVTVIPTMPVATPTLIPTTGPPPGPSPTPGGPGDAARGKQVWVSSEPDPANHPGAHAVDGDPNTFWSSIPDPYTAFNVRHLQWIYVDLGSAQKVKSMRMLWSDTNRPRVYGVYAWHERCRCWSRIADTRYGQVDDRPTFPYQIESRYFMLWLETPNLPGSNYELKSWEVFGDVYAPIQGTNVSSGKASVALTHDPGFLPGDATDADLTTEWRSLGGLPTWIYTDFGTKYNVDRAILRWTAGMHATSYTIYAWDALYNTWRPIHSTTTGAGGDESVRFNAVDTRYLLIYATAGPAAEVGLREFEVYQYGTGSPAPAPGPSPDGISGWRFPVETSLKATSRTLEPDGDGGGSVPDPTMREAVE